MAEQYPRDIIGLIVGWLKVVDHIGYNANHPEQTKSLCRAVHWYKVWCTCGATEIVYRKQLFKRSCCLKCAAIKRGGAEAAPLKQWDLPDNVPDFATLPPPSMAPRPEEY